MFWSPDAARKKVCLITTWICNSPFGDVRDDDGDHGDHGGDDRGGHGDGDHGGGGRGGHDGGDRDDHPQRTIIQSKLNNYFNTKVQTEILYWSFFNGDVRDDGDDHDGHGGDGRDGHGDHGDGGRGGHDDGDRDDRDGDDVLLLLHHRV
ncbi:hypothetical protein CEXT_737761 [Caerostris extrusa]|uniref:Uncharacterized protein n=1 Tax=Caerostris extrusa TaxID=172846 RepID=A0AAV4Y1M1_CAEEX|nr:hypothetical protein CEXT_737761 [Caerostris extrusa]